MSDRKISPPPSFPSFLMQPLQGAIPAEVAASRALSLLKVTKRVTQEGRKSTDINANILLEDSTGKCSQLITQLGFHACNESPLQEDIRISLRVAYMTRVKSRATYLKGVHALVVISQPTHGFLLVLAVLERFINNDGEVITRCLLILEGIEVTG